MFQLCACHSDTPQYNSSETFRNVPLLLSHVCLCAVRFDGYDQIIGGNILARCSRPLIPISAARHYTSILLSCRLASIRCSRCRQALFQDRSAALSFTGVRGKDYLISKGRPYRPGILVCTKCQSFPAPERGEMYRYCQPHRGSKNRS